MERVLVLNCCFTFVLDRNSDRGRRVVAIAWRSDILDRARIKARLCAVYEIVDCILNRIRAQTINNFTRKNVEPCIRDLAGVAVFISECARVRDDAVADLLERFRCIQVDRLDAEACKTVQFVALAVAVAVWVGTAVGDGVAVLSAIAIGGG